MRISKEIVYRCEYCNRAMFNKGAMKLHERMCKKNPENKHKCFQYCRHLQKEEGINGFYFYCDKVNKELYSYKLERFKHKADRLKGLTRMPLECEYYEIDREKHPDYML